MGEFLTVQFISYVILALSVLYLVYEIKDVINWKIVICLLIITNHSIPQLIETIDLKTFNATVLIYLIIYLVTIVGSIVIVRRHRKN